MATPPEIHNTDMPGVSSNRQKCSLWKLSKWKKNQLKTRTPNKDLPQHVCCNQKIDAFQTVPEEKRIDRLVHQSCAEWHASVQTKLANSLTSCRKRKPFLSDCKTNRYS